MVNGTYGIFRGGEVTINAEFFGIDVGPTILRTSNGRNVGFGKGGRRVSVRFNQPVADFEFNATRPSDLDAPIYRIDIGPNAGHAFVAFDGEVMNDIVVIGQPSTNYVVFAKVSWPAGATQMSDLTLSFDERMESRVLLAPNPLNPGDLYRPGMDFGDISFNEPLVSLSVLSEVLQGELKSRSGNSFHVVLIDRDDISGVGQLLTVQPFGVLMRYIENGEDNFKILATRSVATFNYDVTALIGQRIYVYVNPDSGVVGSGTSYSSELGILVSYGDVPLGATGLQDVRFILATEISQANAQAGAEIELFRSALTSGFSSAVTLQPSAVVQNTVSIGKNVAILNGIQFNVPTQQVALPEAPLLGDRLDLMFLEVYRVVEATPTTDGSFYVPLAGVGYLSTKTRIVIAPNVQYGTPEKLMTDPAVVSIGGGNFVRHPLGHYRSPYQGSYDGESWAIPMALFYRFNRDPWSYSNLSGGGIGAGNLPTRPDGKRHDFIHTDEVEVVAPVIPFKGVNYQSLFGQTLDMILRGNHGSQMGVSSLVPTYYSKKPIHVDTIGSTVVPGTRMMGSPDKFRRQWSAMPSPYWVGTNFAVNADYTDELVLYEDGNRSITLRSPVDGEIYLGGVSGDQPITQIVWVESGLPVVLSGAWSVGGDATATSAQIDTTAPGYDPFGTISVSFQVIQRPVNYLGQVPQDVYGAFVNGDKIVLADAAKPSETVTTPTGYTGHVTPIGSALKADAIAVDLILTGNGTDTINLPVTVESRVVLGVIEARIEGGADLPIKTVRIGVNEHAVQFYASVGNGTQVRLKMALGGKVVNFRPRNLSFDEFASGQFFEAIVNGVEATYRVLLPKNRVLKGVLGFIHAEGQPLVAGVYVDNRLYPATVSGLDRNLIEVTLTLSQADYDGLLPDEQTKWEYHVATGVYRLKDGTYSVKLPLLWSDPLTSFDVMNLVYRYSSLPFIQVAPGEVFSLAHRGMLVGSNSSAANEPVDYLSPATEKFPLVRGKRKGVDAVSIQTSLSDVLQIGQLGALPLDGVSFELDGTFKFSAGVMDPDGGFLAWVALVKVNGALRVLTYVVEGDTFMVDSPARAFLTYPLVHYVE